MITLSTDEFHLFSSFIQKECGIALQEDKQYLIESRLTNLLISNGCTSFSEFYLMLKNTMNEELRDKLVDAITTQETLWFRDGTPFTALREHIFPKFFPAHKPCRIWSAACSTGQEPYSIVITAQEYGEQNNLQYVVEKNLSILATDISKSAITLARMGRYNTISMSRGMPPELKEKYFEEEGQICRVKDHLKIPITWNKFNLQMPINSLGKFDVIFLRNVAIYFSHDFKVELFKKLAGALAPGGCLIIGASESLMGYSNDFELVEHDRCRYYQLKA